MKSVLDGVYNLLGYHRLKIELEAALFILRTHPRIKEQGKQLVSVLIHIAQALDAHTTYSTF